MSSSTNSLPPSYSQIDITRSPPPIPEWSSKLDEKIAESKDIHVDIKADKISSSESEYEEVTAAPKRPNLLSRALRWSSIWVFDWGPFLLVATYFVASVFLYIVLPENVLIIFWYFYMSTNFYIAANTVVEAFLSITPIEESRKAVQRMEENGWNFPTSNEDLPILDIAIVAYLPNEKDIIMDRIHYAINKIVYPQSRLRINIVYNTPKPMPLEKDLHAMTGKYSNLRIIKVPQSTSKAENVNHFLSLDIETDLIAIFDCDHYPHPYGPRWAAERFCQDKAVDVVQGRCIVFNASDNFLTAMIAVEFDKIYAVSHPGRATMWGFGLFCGSNGYWKADILRGIAMDESMLTEDIDSALRALAKNVNVVHELNAGSYELAPTTFAGFWKQRLRWAQGWLQASIKHAVLTWNNPEEGNRKLSVRAGLISLLMVRELSYYLVTQYTCLVINFVIMDFPKSPKALAKLIFFQFPVSEWFFIISVICLIATLLITNHVRSEFVTVGMMLKFTVLYPFYLVFSATMGLYGHARQIMGYSSWNPTART